MKRIVKFDGEKAAKRFELARIALINIGDGKAERSRERIRREARLMDLFDSVSEPKDVAKPDGERTLKDGGQSLTLDQADHKIIEDYLNVTPWLPLSARQAVDTQDWWETAEKVEDGPKAIEEKK